MKKFLLSLVAIFTTVGSWAQNVVTAISPGKVYTLECRSGYDHSSTRFIGDNGTIINGRAAEGTYFSFVAVEGGYYIKSVVSGKYLNYEARYNDNGTLQNPGYINAETEPKSVWKINLKKNHAGVVNFTVDNDQYLNNNGSWTKGGCSNLQANKHDGGPNTNNACSLWEMKEYDASILTLGGILQALVDKAKQITAGTKVGELSATYVNKVKAAISVAETALAGEVTQADIDDLQNAIDAVEVIMPTPGVFYQIAHYNDKTKVAYAGVNNSCSWGENATASGLWVFEEGSAPNKFYLKNLHTGSYATTYSKDATVVLAEKNQEVTVVYHNQGRQMGIAPNGGQMFNRATGRLCAWTDVPGKNSNCAWIIEEVDNASVSHTLTIGDAGWSTLILGYNTMIPEDVDCYVVSEVTETSAKLEQVTDVLPANVAVVVNATPGNYEFAYTTNEATLESKLEGTLFTTNVTPEAGITCYVLSNPAEGLGFYQAALTDGHFQNNANKVYLPVANTTSQVLKFNFGTTGIEGVESNPNTAKSVIYDLSGRRVNTTSKGIYIQNGKKFIVK